MVLSQTLCAMESIAVNIKRAREIVQCTVDLDTFKAFCRLLFAAEKTAQSLDDPEACVRARANIEDQFERGKIMFINEIKKELDTVETSCFKVNIPKNTLGYYIKVLKDGKSHVELLQQAERVLLESTLPTGCKSSIDRTPHPKHTSRAYEIDLHQLACSFPAAPTGDISLLELPREESTNFVTETQPRPAFCPRRI